jgi:hypothetical protein
MTKLQASMQDSRDPIRKSRINELFEELMPNCYNDAEILVKNPVTEKVGGSFITRLAPSAPTTAKVIRALPERIALAITSTHSDLCARACPGTALLFR